MSNTDSTPRSKNRAVDFYRTYMPEVTDRLNESGLVFSLTPNTAQGKNTGISAHDAAIERITRRFLCGLFRKHAKAFLQKRIPVSEDTLNRIAYEKARAEMNCIVPFWKDAPCIVQKTVLGTPRYK